MAKKKDGITDLTKLSVLTAERFTPSQFKLFQSTVFAMLNGVQFGYTEMGPQFLKDTNDLYDIHSKKNKTTKKVLVRRYKVKKNNSNIIDLKSYIKKDVTI